MYLVQDGQIGATIDLAARDLAGGTMAAAPAPFGTFVAREEELPLARRAPVSLPYIGSVKSFKEMKTGASKWRNGDRELNGLTEKLPFLRKLYYKLLKKPLPTRKTQYSSQAFPLKGEDLLQDTGYIYPKSSGSPQVAGSKLQ